MKHLIYVKLMQNRFSNFNKILDNLPGACGATVHSPFGHQSLDSDRFLRRDSHPVVESQNLADRLVERVSQFRA